MKIKTPRALRCVILLPELQIRTREARAILSPNIKLSLFIEASANLTGFLLACGRNDMELLKRSLRDVIIEPQRAQLIPGFYELQAAAFRAGALGFSLSGSGPAMFALCAGPVPGARVRKALLAQAQALALPLKGSWLSRIAPKGARLVR